MSPDVTKIPHDPLRESLSGSLSASAGEDVEVSTTYEAHFQTITRLMYEKTHLV